MKTLDEVIETAPYIGTEWTNDALYYLKEYKNKQNIGTMMFALHNTNKTVCDDCWLSREMAKEGFKQIYKKYIEEENPPLTWNELQTMEGKPIWVEGSWEIIASCYEEYFSTDTGGIYYRKNDECYGDYGKDWQAYRREKR